MTKRITILGMCALIVGVLAVNHSVHLRSSVVSEELLTRVATCTNTDTDPALSVSEIQLYVIQFIRELILTRLRSQTNQPCNPVSACTPSQCHDLDDDGELTAADRRLLVASLRSLLSRGSCGNGIVEGNELCDDGDPALPGCTDSCTVAEGYRCTTGTGASVCSNKITVSTLQSQLETLTKNVAVAWDNENQKAYLFGGEGTRIGPHGETFIVHSTDILVFDPVADTITDTGDDLPFAPWSSTALWDPVRKVAYLAGGYTERTTVGQEATFMIGAIVAYDPVRHEANIVAGLPSPRMGISMVWDSKRHVVYMIGGTRGYGRYAREVGSTCSSNGTGEYCVIVASEIVKFDPATNTVTTFPFNYPEVTAIDDPAVYVPTEDKVYIFGYHGQGYTLNQGAYVYVFDPSAEHPVADFLRNGKNEWGDDLFVELPGIVREGLYLQFHAFWDEQVQKVRLFGGTHYNYQYEPGASRFHTTTNYRFDPVTKEFSLDTESSAPAQTTLAWAWDSVRRVAYLFGGQNPEYSFIPPYKTIQKFTFF